MGGESKRSGIYKSCKTIYVISLRLLCKSVMKMEDEEIGSDIFYEEKEEYLAYCMQMIWYFVVDM